MIVNGFVGNKNERNFNIVNTNIHKKKIIDESADIIKTTSKVENHIGAKRFLLKNELKFS